MIDKCSITLQKFKHIKHFEERLKLQISIEHRNLIVASKFSWFVFSSSSLVCFFRSCTHEWNLIMWKNKTKQRKKMWHVKIQFQELDWNQRIGEAYIASRYAEKWILRSVKFRIDSLCSFKFFSWIFFCWITLRTMQIVKMRNYSSTFCHLLHFRLLKIGCPKKPVCF